MALTADLVASIARAVDDTGPLPGVAYMTDADYDRTVEDLLARRPAGKLWIFAYGSLLWKPACEFAESRRATAQGWHRAFCFRVSRFRGTVDRPGLMMALDRGGQCEGMIFRIPEEQVRESLEKLLRREMTAKPAVNVPRWLRVRTREGPLHAIGFVVDRHNERYVGRLNLEEVASVLAWAAGHWGSCAEYLHETVAHLDDLGIRDRNLWRLQALVAERIRAGRSP